MKAPLLALAGLLMGPVAASAQQPAQLPQRTPWVQHAAHYGKWLTGAAAVAFTAMAAHEHRRSDDHWRALLDLCSADSRNCVLAADGRYVNATAEYEYQSAVAFDGRARTRLLGAQAALLVTAALFLVDVARGADGPDNIPLAPLRLSGDPATGRIDIGVRLAF